MEPLRFGGNYKLRTKQRKICLIGLILLIPIPVFFDSHQTVFQLSLIPITLLTLFFILLANPQNKWRKIELHEKELKISFYFKEKLLKEKSIQYSEIKRVKTSKSLGRLPVNYFVIHFKKGGKPLELSTTDYENYHNSFNLFKKNKVQIDKRL